LWCGVSESSFLFIGICSNFGNSSAVYVKKL
jgi:hypothetical protein